MSSSDTPKIFRQPRRDFEECEWAITGEKNEVVSDVKAAATRNYQGTDVRVDQYGPYRIAFRTKDNKKNRLTYEEVKKLAEPLHEMLGLPIYIGGSNSPLSKKKPNNGSDIDIYVITDGYSYEQSRRLAEMIKARIGERPEFDRCSIGQVERSWLELPYFYEAVPYDEEKWWHMTDEEIDEELERRKERATKVIEEKTPEQVIEEIERAYGIKLDPDDIVAINSTPRWRSINDCSLRRAKIIAKEPEDKRETFDLHEMLGSSNEWLQYEDENTSLYDALMNVSKKRREVNPEGKMLVYTNVNGKNGKYWLYNSTMNAIAEGMNSGSKEIVWIVDGENSAEREAYIAQARIMISKLSEYFDQDISVRFDNLDEFFERNGQKESLEKFRKTNRDTRMASDTELKLYIYSKLAEANKLFIINPNTRISKFMRRSGLKITLPFLNKELDDFSRCPDYGKKPPAGYCLGGARAMMFGVTPTYDCICDKLDDSRIKEFDEFAGKLWRDFDEHVKVKGEKSEEEKPATSFTLFDKSKRPGSEKSIILFGAPSIDLKNLLLAKTSARYSKKKTTVIVEDIMAPYLYGEGIYDPEHVKELYRGLEDDRTEVIFTSEDPDFEKSVESWLKRLKISDLKQLSPYAINSNTYGYHAYDALHLAIMGATYERVKDKIAFVHAYNETALHIFDRYLGDTAGYVSCHNIPGTYYGGGYRVAKPEEMDEELIGEIAEGITVVHKDKSGKNARSYKLALEREFV